MITIIYPYRNREPERVKKSLDSLVQQTNKEFNVVFVDYGSKNEIAVNIKSVVQINYWLKTVFFSRIIFKKKFSNYFFNYKGMPKAIVNIYTNK